MLLLLNALAVILTILQSLQQKRYSYKNKKQKVEICENPIDFFREKSIASVNFL